jgi:N-acetylglucosamine kinase-like BadF-type ATPase
VEDTKKFLNITDSSGLIPWAYDEKDQTWQRIAALAPLASEASKKGDAVATKIIDHAAISLSVHSTYFLSLNL